MNILKELAMKVHRLAVRLAIGKKNLELDEAAKAASKDRKAAICGRVEEIERKTDSICKSTGLVPNGTH